MSKLLAILMLSRRITWRASLYWRFLIRMSKSLRFLYQQAKEILDYAQTGYSPGVINVYSIRDQRYFEYEKALQSLAILEDIRDNQDTEALIDSEWSSAVESGKRILSLTNNLSYAQEELIREMG